MDKKVIPTYTALTLSLADTCEVWKIIEGFVHLKYLSAVDEWSYSGAKHGWSFRIKDKKRAIIYLLTRDSFFKVAFVFGQKATDAILTSRISDAIKSEIASARVYAEGRGIRIDVTDDSNLNDIKGIE